MTYLLLNAVLLERLDEFRGEISARMGLVQSETLQAPHQRYPGNQVKLEPSCHLLDEVQRNMLEHSARDPVRRDPEERHEVW